MIKDKDKEEIIALRTKFETFFEKEVLTSINNTRDALIIWSALLSMVRCIGIGFVEQNILKEPAMGTCKEILNSIESIFKTKPEKVNDKQ